MLEVEALQVPKNAQERLLRQVSGILAVGHEPPGDARSALLVTLDQALEAAFVACLGETDQIVVRGLSRRQ